MNLTDMATFFIICPVGMEDLGKLELEEKYPSISPDVPLVIKTIVPGGMEIECPFLAGLKLNFVLKTPTRILLRLSEFKCRDFPKLYQKMSKFNWATWMLGQAPMIECSSKNSRLFDSRKIEKAIADGIKEFYRHKPAKKKYLDHEAAITEKSTLPKIYFRAEDDLVTVSLDTTGERLNLRGVKMLAGLAPIRENLASLLLLELNAHMDTRPFSLIDPMCGSGTFLIEAKHFYRASKERDFAFFHLPIVMENPLLFKDVPVFEKPFEKSLIEKAVGFDISADVIAQAKRNDPEGEYHVEDVMAKTTHSYENAAVIVNPPYGIRVGENINLDFFLRLIRSIKNKFQPQVLGIIVPAEHKIYSNEEWKVIKSRPFKNGGLDVVFYVIKF